MALRKDEKLKYGSTVYYSDPLNDDFEKTNLKRNPLPGNYVYLKHGFFQKVNDFIWYYCICKPILAIIMRLSGFKYRNRSKVKKLIKEGCYFYGNHTSYFDVFAIQVTYPRTKSYIIGYTDALGLPAIIRFILRHVGYLPLPTALKDYKKFNDALHEISCVRKENIIIFPEAHIWPFYTKIRNFSSVSFSYPAKYNKPVVPVVTCYRKSRLSKKAKATIFYLDPIYPKPELNEKENKQYLHDECLKAMKKCVEENSTYEYVHYVYKGEENEVQN